MATYDQWNIWRTFNMYLEIKMATMFSAVINVRLTSNVYEVRPGQITIWKCRQISVVYICPDLKKKNLLRRLSDIVSFMLLQNKYKKCDYCLLLLSLFCVVCALPSFQIPLNNDPLSQACPSPGRQARTQHTLHTRLVCCVVFSCLVLAPLMLSCFLYLSICFLHLLFVFSLSIGPPW